LFLRLKYTTVKDTSSSKRRCTHDVLYVLHEDTFV
jgi:hypothetical protein